MDTKISLMGKQIERLSSQIDEYKDSVAKLKQQNQVNILFLYSAR